MARHVAALVAIVMLSGWPFQVAANSYTHYRLPGSIQPERYHLKVITHLDNPADLTFNGEVSIRFKVLEDTNNITLHVQNLTIDESRIQLQSYDDDDFRLCLESIDKVLEQDYYIMSLCQTLLKGQGYEVKLYFSGILNKKWSGYYRSSYVDEATNETRWLSATQFEAADARAAFPCLDEPNYKAKFTIWMGHHKSFTALSNMPLEKQIPLDGLNDFVWSIFEESVPMSTYLVAYTVNDFAYKESRIEGSNVVFRTWSRPDYIDQCDYAAEVGPKLLKYYEELFGIPFPLKKIDQIAIPHFKQGAMENWGLITYRESVLLYAPSVSTQSNKKATAETVAHELAHQWFGNLVTMKWWTDLWLNEGFATYISSLGVHYVNPQYEMYNEDSLLSSLKTFFSDVKLNSHPISEPIFNVSEIPERFDSISYDKGSVVLRMIHMLIGQDAFFEGVRDYLTKHKYKNAEQDDLWAAFTETAHKFNSIKPQYDMKTIMDSWTLQTGYPLVKVSRNYETGSIEIKQQRFLKNSTIPDEEANKCWWIPLSYTTSAELDFTTTTPKAWLECDESGKSVPLTLDNVTGADEWIMFNIQLSGDYRVLYDVENWRLIRNTLNSDKFTDIHAINRAHIIEDVLSFAWGGYQGYDIAFDILEYLKKEHEYLPWKSSLCGLTDILTMLEPFPQHEAYFKAYMRYILEPVYHYVVGLNDTIETKLTHSQLNTKHLLTRWACRVELDDCVQTAINYFQQWKLSENPDEENEIPVDLRGSIYCTALRRGDYDDWSFLWMRYKKSNVVAEKMTIINSLACSRNETVLKEFIDLIFDKENQVSEEDAVTAFGAVALSAIGGHIAREFYAGHIARLHEYFDAATFLDILASGITSTEELNEFSNIVVSNKEYFKNSEKSVKAAFEGISSNIQWIEHNLADIKSNLQTRLSLMGLLQDNVID